MWLHILSHLPCKKRTCQFIWLQENSILFKFSVLRISASGFLDIYYEWKQVSSIDGRVFSQQSFSVKSDAGDVSKVMLGNIPGHWDWTIFIAQLLCPTYVVKWLIKMIPGTYSAQAVSKAVPGGITECALIRAIHHKETECHHPFLESERAWWYVRGLLKASLSRFQETILGMFNLVG